MSIPHFSVLAAAFVMNAAAPQDDCRPESKRSVMETFVPNRVLVRRGIAPPPFFPVWGEFILKREAIGGAGLERVDSPVLSTDELRELFRQVGVYAEPDHYIYAHAPYPNDPAYQLEDRRRGLVLAHAPEAWNLGQGDRSVVAAILDSGMLETHEDLCENRFNPTADFSVQVDGTKVRCRAGEPGYDAVDGDCQPGPRTDHGTKVAGIIGAAGNNCKGHTGVNWDVTLLPVTVLDDGNSGCESRAIKALEFVRGVREQMVAPIRVVNLSWGNHEYSRLVEEQLELLAACDIVIVASAGNEGNDNDEEATYPAGYRGVSTLISVTGANDSCELLGRCNYGDRSVDIAAPALDIYTTSQKSLKYGRASMTSMAAPFVTGAVALLASQCPGLTGIELRDLVLNSSDPTPALDPYVIGGRFLNIGKAAEACKTLREAAPSP